MSRGRKPRPDELELWRQVAGTADRIAPAKKLRRSEDVAAEPKKAPTAEPVFSVDLPRAVIPKTQTRSSVNLAPNIADHLRKQPVQMDRKAFGHMIKGKLSPEARIDLHGMTLDRAHGALSRFILSQHAAGKRLVLVITGKGKARETMGPIPERMGVLRHQVPHWLGIAPLRQVVLQVSPAHQKHGGIGAYYVYLRKSR